MFIFNFKLSKSWIAKLLIVTFACISIILCIIGTIKIINEITKEKTLVESDCMPEGKVANLTEKNYTNILKMVHENLNNYIGQEISFTGYVYRVPNINEDEFILARDMYIDKNHLQSVIVGFLCKVQNANDFKAGDWVKITGTIQKGYYYGDIPIIEISQVTRVEEPKDKFVEPPEETFIPTALIY